MLKVLVVYDTVYGNTRTIAQAIADAIASDVRVLPGGEAKVGDLEEADLLIIGSPTHGAMPTEAIQRLVGWIGPPSRKGARVATFDTRLTWRFLDRWGGFAAPKMAEALEQKGWTLAAPPEGFLVGGLRKGPLKRDEARRAAAWARRLVEGGT
jgi:flavodoxin